MGKIENLRLELIERVRGSFREALLSAVSWSMNSEDVAYCWLSSAGYQIAFRNNNAFIHIQHAKIGRFYTLHAVEPCGPASIPAQVYYLIDPVFVPTRKPR